MGEVWADEGGDSLIICFCGPRDVHIAPVAEAVKASGFLITRGITGEGTGIDQVAKEWIVATLGKDNYKGFPAKWNDFSHPRSVRKYRKDGSVYNASAGPIRNGEMSEVADAVIAFVNCAEQNGSGTWDMVRQARSKNLPVFLWILPHECDYKVKSFSEDSGSGIWACWCGEEKEREAKILCRQEGLF